MAEDERTVARAHGEFQAILLATTARAVAQENEEMALGIIKLRAWIALAVMAAGCVADNAEAPSSDHENAAQVSEVVPEEGFGGPYAAPLAEQVDPATGPGCGSQSLRAGTHPFTHRSANGMTYKYFLVIPPGYVPTRRAPTLFFWHALTSNAAESRDLLHIDQSAASRGMITVHPQSPDASWDVGSCCSRNVLGKVRNEEVFVRELVAAVQAKVCVDSSRIYSSGFSNGGMMTNYIACKAPDLFAAGVSMSGTLTIPQAQCKPSRTMPLLLINGTSDPLVGYNSVALSGGLSATDAFRFWGRTNGCQGQPVQTLARGKATCAGYQSCQDGVEVGLCTVNGMGHCVNGMKKESRLNCLTRLILPLGPPNDDIDGIDTALDFLMRWTKP